jgi:hypothetical protein
MGHHQACIKRCLYTSFENKVIYNNVLGKKWNTEHSKRNKTILEKVDTTRTEDGHK